VWLNLTPGVLTVTDVLGVLGAALPIERAALMDPAPDSGDGPPPVHPALVEALPPGTPIDHVSRFDFYTATASDQLALVIATADLRPYANVLLTVGVVRGDG
jgi:L-fucose mutarotase